MGLVCLLAYGLYLYVRYYRWRHFEDDRQDLAGITYVDGLSPREAKAFEAEWRRRWLEPLSEACEQRRVARKTYDQQARYTVIDWERLDGQLALLQAQAVKRRDEALARPVPAVLRRRFEKGVRANRDLYRSAELFRRSLKVSDRKARDKLLLLSYRRWQEAEALLRHAREESAP